MLRFDLVRPRSAALVTILCGPAAESRLDTFRLPGRSVLLSPLLPSDTLGGPLTGRLASSWSGSVHTAIGGTPTSDSRNRSATAPRTFRPRARACSRAAAPAWRSAACCRAVWKPRDLHSRIKACFLSCSFRTAAARRAAASPRPLRPRATACNWTAAAWCSEAQSWSLDRPLGRGCSVSISEFFPGLLAELATLARALPDWRDF